MPEPRTVLKPFDSYRVTYAVTNPNGRDYARIDLFDSETKVGQILFGSAIAPGSYAGLHSEEIHLYFPLTHFENIARFLRHQNHLSLYVELDREELPQRGGITSSPQP
jgi:hypothetical protein